MEVAVEQDSTSRRCRQSAEQVGCVAERPRINNVTKLVGTSFHDLHALGSPPRRLAAWLDVWPCSASA